MIKKTAILLVSWCLLLLAAASCRPTAPEENAVAFTMSDTMMARCRFDTARMSDVRNELRLFGKISADNNRIAQVYSIVGGSVMKIYVELGDYVQQGQVLAEVRSGEIADFEKQLLDARSDVALAEKDLQVAEELFAGKLNSERDVNSARKELEKANAELRRIKEIYAIYNLKNGSVYSITAPIGGFIVFKNINQNEQLRSDNTSPLFSIAQIDEVWMLANVNETDIAKIQTGYEAEIHTLSYPRQPFKGKIDRIFSAIDPGTKAMKVLVKIPNPDHLLKPEMSATVYVRYSENRQMIEIPSSAVIFDKSRNWVMVFKDRRNIETRQVEVYRQLNNVTYISSGLQEGETVISQNGLMIYDALND